MTPIQKVAEQNYEMGDGNLDASNRERQLYEAPGVNSFKPLEIMSAWEDRSSELPGI